MKSNAVVEPQSVEPPWREVLLHFKLLILETPLSRRIASLILFLSIIVSNGMQFFGMNFLLFSITDGSQMFTTLVLPTVVWAIFFTTALTVVQCTSLAMPDAFFMFRRGSRRALVYLGAIGVLDAVAGLTSAFSTYHTPMVLQSLLMSLAPLWTHVGSAVVGMKGNLPHPPWTVGLAVVLATFVLATLVTLIPQFTAAAFSLGWWTAVFLASCLAPPMYNVLQGKFLTSYGAEAPGWAGKGLMLSADTLVQCVCCVAFFPADFSPWFGETDSAAASWKGFAEGVREIFGRWDTAAYFFVYTFGYIGNHVAFAVANKYSPTLGCAVGLVGGPVNTMLLVIIPALNLSKMRVSVWLEIISTVLVSVASLGYAFLSLRHMATTEKAIIERFPLLQESSVLV